MGRLMALNSGQTIAAIVVLSSLALIVFQATRGESSVTFYTPEEVYGRLAQFQDKIFRVSGLVLKGSRIWNGKSHTLQFRMSDLKGHDFLVTYVGVPPDLFKEGQGVVVEGKLRASSFSSKEKTLEAHLLMVKHSEVYDTKRDHSKMQEARLLDSMGVKPK